MRDDQSFDENQRRIALEMAMLVQDAAKPVEPGESVKAQINKAWENLGRPPYWRVRAAWWGEAGRWVGTALEEFRARKTALDNKRRGIEDAKSRARDAASGPEARAMRQNLPRLREALAVIDAKGNREEIRALDWVLGSSHD